MIILSMNIRGVRGAPKLRALRRIFEIVRPDVILIQETTTLASRACRFFLNILRVWEVLVIDLVGYLGGIMFI